MARKTENRNTKKRNQLQLEYVECLAREQLLLKAQFTAEIRIALRAVRSERLSLEKRIREMGGFHHKSGSGRRGSSIQNRYIGEGSSTRGRRH
jgi:hypothetical protein